MKKIVSFLIIPILFLSSCKTEEQLGNPLCEYTVYPKPDVPTASTFVTGLMGGDMSFIYINRVRENVYGIAVQGGNNSWIEQASYYLTTDDWFAQVDTGSGGPACAGTSYFGLEILDTLNPEIQWAALSIGNTDWADNRGHVLTVVGIIQNGDTVYSVQDFMFNVSLVYRATGLPVDIRDVDSMIVNRTLDELTMFTENIKPTWYLSQHECIETDHPMYDEAMFQSIHESGRTEYPYLVYAPRTLVQYGKYFSWNGDTFISTYTEILATHGITGIDLSKPENLPYILGGIRGIYKKNGNFVVNSEILHSEIDKMVVKKSAMYKK